MIPYVVLFTALLGVGFLEIYKAILAGAPVTIRENSKRQLYVLVPALIIFAIGILRETTVGYDTETYYIYYWLQVDKYSWFRLFTDFTLDNGFFLILKAISVFTDDWWLARAILFVITFLLYFWAFKKESRYPSTSLLIFLGLANLGLMLSILRQALAGGICIFAYSKIKNESRIKYLLLVLLATTIHKSALVCVFVIVVHLWRKRKFSVKEIILYSVASFLAFLVGIPLIAYLYADSRYEGITNQNGGYGMLLFMIVIVAILGRLIIQTKAYSNREASFLFNVSCGALFLQMGALQWDLLNRLTPFFSIYWCILFPDLIHRLPQRKRVWYYFVLAVLFGFMFFYQIAEVELFVMHKF